MPLFVGVLEWRVYLLVYRVTKVNKVTKVGGSFLFEKIWW
jgi:hypothetical protein